LFVSKDGTPAGRCVVPSVIVGRSMTSTSGPRARLSPAALLLGLVIVGATAVAPNAAVAEVSGGIELGAGIGPVRQPPAEAAATSGGGERARAFRPTRPRRAFPNSRNTGVPRGLKLTPYKGSCTVTRDDAVIEAKTVNCDLDIRAGHVVISRSKINGYVSSGEDKHSGYSFTLRRSTVDASPGDARQVTAVGEVHFRVIRSHVYGGNRSANCWYVCKIIGSYVHGQDTDRSGTWHESGIRMGEKSVIRGNTIACDAPNVPPDAGCSAPLTGYGDFGPVQDNVIDGNLFKATTGGTCAYGGSSGGKPFSNAAREIRFTNNVFERGKSGHCGYWEPILDFDRRAPGNLWQANVWDSGGRVRP
jgi:hypothetical protein